MRDLRCCGNQVQYPNTRAIGQIPPAEGERETPRTLQGRLSEPSMKQAIEMQDALERIAREDGFKALNESPGRLHLFRRYLSENDDGYSGTGGLPGVSRCRGSHETGTPRLGVGAEWTCG